MTLADHYADITIGEDGPEVLKLADALVRISAERARIPDDSDWQKHSVSGRYTSLNIAPDVQFFSCDMQFTQDTQWQSRMPPGIWVGALFSGASATRLQGVEIQFPGNGLPMLLSVGQPSDFTDIPMSMKRLRMSSFLMGKGFFDDVGADDPTDHMRGLKNLMRPGVNVLPLGPLEVLSLNLRNLLDNPYCGATGKLFVESHVMASIFELACHLNDCPVHNDRSAHSDLAYDARNQINQAPEQFQSISALAVQLGTNETTLRRAFKSVMGVTIFEYVLNCRMQAARVLVRDRVLQIAEIAYLVGYSSPSNFTAAYKKYFGHTPVEDR
ncbi:AraC-type DNA-binding protein [Aliiroseovarius halocynthiae]|uniref:Helix-turn-helix transcriptional regulator n=1 Tax=Aliiroseovarius halocynthiae TaxID=985055 RepID=A0A545SLA4_9RHOB|nr:AraC family transcriptional regulator [Aliiroseovarius halocynthiae]TQV65763.1 helix-turn-helix transcriptional regulator [Aliiroseovarius halocynthiae]SMR83529.1 AraC-type DNA-binding protein [Aliiroseovarius halocynthiae]